MPTDPIPQDLARAFRDAVDFFQSSWSPAVHGREVSVEGKGHKIGDVCRLVAYYAEDLPADLLHRLLSEMDLRHAKLKDELAQHPTYGVAAKCLSKIIEDREKEYQQSISKS
jgi:hypothetical protein